MHRRHSTGGGSCGPGDFFGVDTESMHLRARVVLALSVLVPAMLGVAGVLVFFGEVFWLVFTFGWMIFPAFGLLTSGIADMASNPSNKQLKRDATETRERELLEALRDNGELTSAQAAIQTSLSVHEADEKLRGLAEGGYLDVRVRGGGLFYALWDAADDERKREIS